MYRTSQHLDISPQEQSRDHAFYRVRAIADYRQSVTCFGKELIFAEVVFLLGLGLGLYIIRQQRKDFDLGVTTGWRAVCTIFSGHCFLSHALQQPNPLQRIAFR